MTKNRKISAAVVLLPLMLIFAMFMVSGCDWLFDDGENTGGGGNNGKGEKIGEITGTITLTNIPATGRPTVSIRAGIDAAGLSYDSDISQISLSGVSGTQTQAVLNWAIPVYENEEIPPRARFGLIVTPQGTTSSLYIDITNPVNPEFGPEIDIPANHVVGSLGTYSIGTTVLSGTINVTLDGNRVPNVEMRAYSDLEDDSLGYVRLSSPTANAPWTLVMPLLSAQTDLVLEIRGVNSSWTSLFKYTFESTSLTKVSGNKSGINVDIGNIITLTSNTWAAGTLSSTAAEKLYLINAVEDTKYYIYVNDIDWDRSKMDVVMDVYYVDGEMIFPPEYDITGTYTENDFTADRSGVVCIKVHPYISDDPVIYGSFEVAYNTTGTRPDTGSSGEIEGNTITITDIPEAYFGHRINVYIISSTNELYSEEPPSLYGYYGEVDNSSMTLELFDSNAEEPWTGTGLYYVFVSFSSQDYENFYNYVSKNQVTFGTNPSINFSTGFNVFKWSGEEEEEEEGKTVTITNIPDIYFDTDIYVRLFESNTNIIFSGFFSSASGYGVVDNLSSLTLELVYPISDDPWTETGSYYVTVSFADYTYQFDHYISKNKVDFKADTTDVNFATDFVKYNDFAPPADTVPLIENIWESGYLSSSEPIKWYKFNVEKDTDYEIFINDYDWDWDYDYNKADVLIDIYLNGVKIRSSLDIGVDDDTGEFTADASGTVHVRVYMYETGSFDIGYSTSRDRDDLEWPSP